MIIWIVYCDCQAIQSHCNPSLPLKRGESAWSLHVSDPTGRNWMTKRGPFRIIGNLSVASHVRSMYAPCLRHLQCPRATSSAVLGQKRHSRAEECQRHGSLTLHVLCRSFKQNKNGCHFCGPLASKLGCRASSFQRPRPFKCRTCAFTAWGSPSLKTHSCTIHVHVHVCMYIYIYVCISLSLSL